MRKLLPYGARAFLCLLLVGMSSWLYAGSPLSGAYTINSTNPASSTNFTSFSMAADSLTTNGVSGAVTITVSAGVYNEYMTLGAIAGASGTNTITFDGGDTATTSIVHDGTTENHTILLDGARWVTITNLKIVNSKTVDDAWGVRIANESDNSTIDNCRIQMGVVTAFEDIAGILMNGSATASSGEGTYGDNVTISNTTIFDGYYGLRLESSAWNDTSTTVTNCGLIGNIGYGMYVDNLVGLSLTGNKVEGASLTSKDGFYMFDLIDFNITANKIDVPDYGLYIADGNFDLTLPATRSKIVNNMLVSSTDEPLYLDDFQQCDVFHNTCATFEATLSTAYGIYTNDLDDVTFKNNIFYSKNGYAFYCADNILASATVFVDYNDYYTEGATLAYISFSNQFADLAAWQTADATNNANSVEGDPVFGAGTDVHVSGTVANDVGDNGVGIGTDIDGDFRPLAPSFNVDIGADEFAPATCQPPTSLAAMNLSATTADISWITGGATNWQIQYGPSGFTLGSGTVVSATSVTTTLTGLMSATDYDVYVLDSCGATDISTYTGPVSFTTLCIAFNSFPWLEDFETNTSAIPNCWENEAGDNSDWIFRSGSIGHGSPSDNTSGSGFYAGADDSHSNSNDTVNNLLTPAFDLTSLTAPRLNFYHYIGDDATLTSTLYIDVYDGTTWNMAVATIGFTAEAWQQELIDLTAYKSVNSRIRFRVHETTDFNSDISIDDVMIEETPACVAPTGLGIFGIAAHSASAGWLSAGTSFEVEYGAAGFTIGSGMNMATVNDTFGLASLTAATDYDLYVREICAVGDTSSWVGPVSFTTLCSTFPAPYAESFDGTSTPNCWEQSTTGGGGPWVFSTSLNSVNCAAAPDHTGNSGNYAWMDQSSTDGAVHLTSPEIDVTALTTPYLGFYYWMCGAGYTPPNMTVIETWDGSAWVYLDTLDQATAGWEEMGYNLSGKTYATNLIKVRFTALSGGHSSDFFGDNGIDDVSVMEAPACASPSNLSAYNVTDSSAALTWTTGGASNWNIEIGLAGFTPGSGTMFAVTNDSIGLQGMAAQTAYEFYVQDSCGLGDVSPWIGPYAFTTLADCPMVNGIPYFEFFNVSEGCFVTIDGGAASGDGWAHTVNAGQNLDGTGYMRVDSDANGNGTHMIESLESPLFDASAVGNGLILEFDHYFRPIGGDSGTVQVYDGTAWINVATYTGTQGAWAAPAHEIIDVTAYANAAFQVRFHYDDGNSWAWYWAVDNFSLEDKCPAQALPYTNNFDADASCFRVGDAGGATGDTWAHTINAGQNLDGTGYMRVDSDANGNGVELFEVLRSADIDASGVTGTLMLEFDHYYRSVSGDTGWVNVWDGSAWQNVAMFTASVGGWSSPDHQMIDISAYANDFLSVEFIYSDGNNWAWYWAVDNFSVAEVACLPPSALMAYNETQNTADVTWAAGGAMNWNIEYGLQGFTPGTGMMMSSTNDTATLAGLLAGMTYDFYVQDSCAVGDVSSWTGPASFTTLCGPFIAPYSESFDGTSIPNCWSTAALTGGPWTVTGNPNTACGTVSDHSGNGGNFVWMDQSGTDDSVVLLMNEVDVSALTVPYLEFYYFMCGSGYTPVNHTIIHTWDGTGWVYLDSISTGTVGWEEKGYDLTGRTYGANFVKVRFTAESGGSGSDFRGDNAIDDVSIIEMPTCFNPSGLGVTALGITSADVYWTTGGAANWNVQYGPAGFALGTGTTMAASNDTITISGLIGNTAYDFYVQDSCGLGDVGVFVGPMNFTTECDVFNTFPWVENFDAAAVIPNCWENEAGDNSDWIFRSGFIGHGATSDNTTGSGNYAGVDDSQSNANDTVNNLLTPSFDLSSLVAPRLNFYHFIGNDATLTSTLYIDVYDGTTWNMAVATIGFTAAVWQQELVDLTPYISTNSRIRFRAHETTDFNSDISIDDVTIEETPSCAAPSNLSAFAVNDTFAAFAWTGGGASNWNFEIGLAGFTPGSGIQFAVTNDTTALQGFTPGTQYEFYVQDSCGLGDVSPWVGPFLFTTTNSCPAIESIPYFEFFNVSEGCFDTIDGGAASGDGWAHTVNAGQNLDGTGYMRVDSDANGNGVHMIEDMESPVFDASAVGNGLILEFDHYYRAIGSDSATVQVFDGTAWVNVATYTGTQGAWGAPAHEIIDVTAYANAAFQVRFHYDDANSWAWYWAVDNFTLEDKCPVQALPYTNNFDADASCFRVGDGGGATGDTWAHTVNAGQNLDGTGYMRVDSDANGNGVELFEVLRSPDINATGITGTLMLEFDHYFRSIGAADTGWVNVWDGSAWQNVALVTATTGGWSAPTHEMIDISAYANDFLSVEFIYSDGNSWAWYWSVDNFSVAEVGCLQPSALTAYNETQNTADVTWMSGGASNWNLEYGPQGFTPGTGTMVAATNDTVTLMSLLSGTSYDVYVQDSCGIGSVSTWEGPTTFATLCATFVAPYTETFTGSSTPNCWSETAVSGGPWLYSTGNNSVNCPQATDHTGNSGNYAWMDQSGVDDSVSLISAEVDVTALTVPYLEFYYWMCGAGYTPANLTIIETWDGTSWSYLDTLDQATAGWEVQGYDLTGRTYGANLVKVRMTAYSGGSASDFFGDNAIDDFSIIEMPSCSAPTALGAVNVTGTSADIFWTTGGASNWNIELGNAGFTPGTGTMFAVTNDTITITGMSPGNSYQFYVQDSCGLGDVSAWVGPFNFVTPVACPPLESLPFFENFDVSEGCFDTIDAGAASGDGWAHTINAAANLDGTGYMRVDSDANGNGVHLVETMESPVIDASAVGNGLILEFDHHYRPIGGDSGTVQVFDGTAWITIATYNTNIGAFGAPVHETYDVTAYANAAFQVRFHYDDGNTWAWYWAVDNFSVEDKCPTQPLPYTNNFDLDASCFRVADLGGAVGDGWAHTINATQNLDGTGYMRVDSDANGNGVELRELLVSPSIDAAGITGTLMLDFDHYYRSIGSDTGWVNVWDGSAWNTVAMFTADAGAWGAPDHQQIDISAYANDDLQVMFEYYDGNTWAWYWSVDNFSVAEVGCIAPTALGMASATQTSADVYWTGGGAANWNVEYGPTGFIPGTGTMLMATNDTVTLMGLMAATCYDFYVQDSCGLGDVSTWTGPFNICTACGPFIAPITESFDGTSTPLCWSEYAVAGGPWLYSTGLNSVNCPGAPDHTGNGGNYAWMDQSSTDTLVTLEMNVVDVSALTTPYLEFFYWMCGSGYTPINKTIVETWDGTNWVLLDTLTLPTVGWERQGYSLAGRTYGANLVKVRFTAESGYGASDFFGDNGLDDISIIEEPACLNPTNLMVTGNTLNSIDLTWTSDVNILSSRIQYGAPGFTPGTGTNFASSPGSGTVTGLMSGTCYEFYVQDSCSSTTAWVGPVIGCTGSPCSVTTMPTTMGDSANCGGGPITLTGTAGSGDMAWMLNGTVLGTGSSYSDSIGGTTLYNAVDFNVVAPAAHIGPMSSIAAAGFGNFSNGQYFTVMDTIFIDSTTVRANGFVEASVVIFDDAGGNLVQIGDTFTTGTTLGDYQVPVGVLLTPGNYFMGIDFHVATTGQLFRATSGASYPYVLPGIMSIDSVNFAGARYYYTFDLVVSGACLGSPVQTIGFVPGPNSGTSDTVNVCETDAAFNLAAALGPHDNGGTWVDVDLSGALTDSTFDATVADTNSYYNFNYILPPSGGCAVGDTATITVLVNFQRSAGTDGSDSLCTDVSQLISLTQYLGSHTGGGSWTDLDTSGALLGIRVRPSNVNGPGVYRYKYTVAASGACPGESSIVTITYSDPVDAGLDNSDVICDTIGVVDLSSYLSAGAGTGGTWVDLDGAGGLSGSMLTASTPTPAATYNFGYVLESAGCGNDTAFIAIQIDACNIGLTERVSNQFNIYPNPTAGVFFIETLGDAARDMKVEVYSMNGQLLLTNKFVGYNESNTVDLTDLAKGVYNVKVFTEYGVEVHRITKQ